ncbi:MAG: phosphoribosylformylglycinamidine synthase I [Omnitrophica WOR_2 bacterium RIFCSPHIGHO2_02_FULL_50_17]|nr:MAG: phosphoribosylformylglycinamidine synthase I [Omnitrophica WOR_2 bacterium RIFCSPHIGHO2_02_FULL_50_17]
MAKEVKVIVLRTAGTNCDAETAFAFHSCGAQVESVHINQLFQGKAHLRDYHILAVPGGFTYGDDIESGRLLANELRLRLGDHLQQFITDGKLIIGICNGFQVLVKAGLLPGPLTEEESQKDNLGQTATLVSNDSGKFEARWVHLKAGGKSIWTEGLEDIVYYPVAHAEGKFVPGNEAVLERLKQNGQVAFRYCTRGGERGVYPENPNGSADDIAGITDTTGRLLGLMPHPERHFLFRQHPFWTRLPGGGRHGQGARIFNNGVNYVEKNLL